MPARVAILLCAGYGTRMGDLAAEVPKPLLPVAGKPVLDYLVEQLVGLPGLDAVHVVSNSHYLPPFRRWADGWHGRLPCGTSLEVHDDGTRSAAERLGAVGDLAFVLDRVGPVAGALVASGDNILRFSLAPLWRAALDGDASRVLALHEPDAGRLRRTGVLELDLDRRVLRLHEKPDEPPSSWACPSIYWLAAAALARVGPYLDAGQPRDETGRFIDWLAARETVLALPTLGERLHVGSPEAWRRADEILRREAVIKPAGRRLENRDT
jgi:NDP-sugar pyrophosphorylase family protein